MLLQLAIQFYTHDKAQGFIVVVIVCGSMIAFASWVAYTNFGPPSKRRGRQEPKP
ncbi:MAG: photosystem II reaction center protein PsbN [Actinomycetota bacterium]|nr:photosystem II reaction center protein PsbN [Actinomycetota bacterium]